MTSYVGDKFKATSEHSLLLQEDEALYLFKQFISAVCYCHRHNLAHRSDFVKIFLEKHEAFQQEISTCTSPSLVFRFPAQRCCDFCIAYLTRPTSRSTPLFLASIT